MAYFSTQFRGNYDVRSIIIDSKDIIAQSTTNECQFTARLAEQINLTGPTEIYLSSIYIGGYKINENSNALYDDSANADIIKYFSIDIPEFDIKQIGGECNPTNTNAYTNMNRRFNLVMESPASAKVSGVLQPSDYKPFVLGHLGKTSIFISEIKPKNLDRITINIKDQEGLDIYKPVTGGGHSVDANPPRRSRHVIMQFLLVEKKDK